MADPHPSVNFNAVVGANVQRFRKAAGLSQSDLAQALTDRGASFQQQTILKVEKGSRPLRLEEAALLADVLHVPVTNLLRSEDDEEMIAAQIALNQAMTEVRRLAARTDELRRELEDTVAQMDEAKDQMVQAQARQVAAIEERESRG